jgi:HEAT repeat protein
MGVGLAFFYTSATSLFLVNFERGMLPYAYIGGGLAIFFFGKLFSYLQKRSSFSTLISGSAIFLLLSVGILLLVFLLTGNQWVTFIMFIWIRIILFIQGISFWGIASKIFDLRQGKRLFGLIGSGEVISLIISFFSIPFILKLLNTEDLLYLSLIGFIISIIFLYIIIKVFKKKLATIKTVQVHDETKETQKPKTSSKPKKSKYFRYFFYMAILPMFAIFFVDFIFFAQTQVEFPDKEVLSSFLGIFFGVGAIIELILKSFVSGRMLSKYGLRLGLISLPFMLLISVLLASMTGMIYGMAGLFFSFVAFSKISLRSVRTSFYDPSFQILYQPLPAEERFAFQSKIEGGPKAYGNIIAGGALLLMVSISSVTLVHFNLVFLVILIGWLIIALKMFSEYRLVLKNLIFSVKNKDEKAIVNKETNINILEEHLLENKTANAYKVFQIFEKHEPYQLAFSLEHLLETSPNEIKTKALDLIEKELLIQLKEPLIRLSGKEPSPEIKQRMLHIIQLLRDAENISYDSLQKMSKSECTEDRRLAAVLLGKSSRYNAYKLVKDLIKDEEFVVKEAALMAAGQLKRFELWKFLIDMLSNPLYNEACISAIRMIGAPILDELAIHFRKKSDNQELQITTIKLIEEIGGEKAINILRTLINCSDTRIRYVVLKGLDRLSYSANISEASFIKIELESQIKLVIWLMAAISDIEDHDKANHLKQSLLIELEEKKDHVFVLLSLIYDSRTIHHIKNNLLNGGQDERVFALEILDMTVAPELKELFLPLLDSLSYADTLHKHKQRFPFEKLLLPERLIDIINKDYCNINAWTKACAMELLQDYPSEESAQVLSANIFSSDRLIQDTAAFTLFSIDKTKFFDSMEMLQHSTKNKGLIDIERITKQGNRGNIKLCEKTKKLKQANFLSKTPETYLSKLMDVSEEISLKRGEKIILDDEYYFYLVLSGEIECSLAGKLVKTYAPSQAFSEYVSCDIIGKGYEYKAMQPTIILKILLDSLSELMMDRKEILLKILSMFSQEEICLSINKKTA